MIKPTYELTLRRSYYDKGFFNLGVAVDRFVRKDSGPASLALGESRTTISVRVDRGANVNGAPRIMGGASLRNWLQRNCRDGEVVVVEISSPNEFWLRRQTI
jgi:hypothetical protein